MKKIYCSN